MLAVRTSGEAMFDDWRGEECYAIEGLTIRNMCHISENEESKFRVSTFAAFNVEYLCECRQ
jgi:hypothetical protein